MGYDVCSEYNCPPPYFPVQFLYLTIGLLAFIPLFNLIRNYHKLGTVDYLIFGGLFFSISINLIILFIKPWNINLDDELLPLDLVILVKIEYIFFNSTYFFVYVHSYRLLWEKPSRFITWGWYLFSLILLGLIVFMLPDEFYIILWAVLTEFYRMTAGFMGVIAYRRVDPINPTYRIQFITRFWKWAGGLIMFNGMLQILIFILYSINWNPIFLSIRSGSIITLMFVAIILTCIIALKYPESMLVSHVQLMRASKLYQKIEEIKKNEENKIKNVSKDELTKYIMSVSHLIRS